MFTDCAGQQLGKGTFQGLSKSSNSLEDSPQLMMSEAWAEGTWKLEWLKGWGLEGGIFTHMPGVWFGATNSSTDMWPLHALGLPYSMEPQTSYMAAEGFRHKYYNQQGSSEITLSDLASEVTQCHFNHILLVTWVTYNYPSSRGGNINSISQNEECQRNCNQFFFKKTSSTHRYRFYYSSKLFKLRSLD